MDALRQKTRPKHQLLILKCYPRLPKNAAEDAKPNGSELSYLLFYASTRRSKLQKVGPFLEKKTASDLYKQRSANITVTLQILEAFLKEKAIGEGSGFALIAPHVLGIVKAILSDTTDVSLVESSVSLWQLFCDRHDESSLNIDHDYRRTYEQTVALWANFAHKDRAKKLGRSTQTVATQDSLRLREAGLKALKAVLAAENLSSDTGRQMSSTIPAVVSNIKGPNGAFLVSLLHQSHQNEEDEKRKAARAAARPSFATVRTDTGSVENDPRTTEGTVADADDFMEGVVATLGLDCLKAVFSPDQRAQVRSASAAILQYFSDHTNVGQRQGASKTVNEGSTAVGEDSWASQLLEMISDWTPVQNRFIVLVTLTETLVRLPLATEADLPRHLLFATILDETLKSDINMIGLSVMDILLSLLRHVAKVLSLQLSGRAGETHHAEVASATDAFAGLSKPPTALQKTLLIKLQACISNLAIHVYYTDQINDTANAILARLRGPPPSSGQESSSMMSNGIRPSSMATEDEKSGSSTPSRGRSTTLDYNSSFSIDPAKVIALNAVKDTFIRANKPRIQETNTEDGAFGTSLLEGRSKTSASVWANTEHLAEEHSASPVRTAYKDAILTWARLEAGKPDWTVEDCLTAVKTAAAPDLQPAKSLSRRSRRSPSNGALASSMFDANTSNHRRFLRVADTSPGRESSIGRSASSSAATRLPRVEDLKRILTNEAPAFPSSTWLPKSPTRAGGRDDVAEDTASESIMDVGDVDLGSEASGPEQQQLHKLGGGKRDVKAILASIKLDETPRPRTARMIQPPY